MSDAILDTLINIEAFVFIGFLVWRHFKPVDDNNDSADYWISVADTKLTYGNYGVKYPRPKNHSKQLTATKGKKKCDLVP